MKPEDKRESTITHSGMVPGRSRLTGRSRLILKRAYTIGDK